MKGTLYLIPNTLGNKDIRMNIPPGFGEKVYSIRTFVVEDLRNARRYLKLLNKRIDIDQLTFHELNDHTAQKELPGFLDAAHAGEDTGLISEAGLPAVADPGASLVRLAHQQAIRVAPLSGPSSLFLALMASGLNGQEFTFHGYLPVPHHERVRRIRNLEKEAKRTGYTQLFMETPYRNDSMMQSILDTCDPYTVLSVAADLTLDTEDVRTRLIKDWKKDLPELRKRPAIFLIGK